MRPFFPINDEKLFYDYLNKSKNYFEFGCGGSTYQAYIRDNIKKIYSVESDIEWQEKVKDKTENSSKISFIFADIGSKPNKWGYPDEEASKLQQISYSNKIRELSINEANELDLILIDGRFRVACCLKCYEVVNDDCLIIFDDFLNRKFYHVVLDYFDIIDKTTDNSMVVLKKKPNLSIQEELVLKYELIAH